MAKPTTRTKAKKPARTSTGPGKRSAGKPVNAAATATAAEASADANGPRYRTMREFWPFYLHEHSRRGTRALHLAGTAVAVGCIVLAILVSPWFLIAALVAGYAFAWVAHFFVEHNRPATFTYPFKSFASDWLMFGAFLTGQLGKQLRKHGVRARS